MKISALIIISIILYSSCQTNITRTSTWSTHITTNSNCIPTTITEFNQTQIMKFNNRTDAYAIANKAFEYAGMKLVMYDQTSYNSFIIANIIDLVNDGRMTLDNLQESAVKAHMFTQNSLRKRSGLDLIDQEKKINAMFAYKDMMRYLRDFYADCYKTQ